MSKTGKFFLGALLGATAAVLLTPLNGRQTRSGLKKIVKSNQGGIKKLAEEITSKAEAILQTPAPKRVRKTNTKKQ